MRAGLASSSQFLAFRRSRLQPLIPSAPTIARVSEDGSGTAEETTMLSIPKSLPEPVTTRSMRVSELLTREAP